MKKFLFGALFASIVIITCLLIAILTMEIDRRLAIEAMQDDVDRIVKCQFTGCIGEVVGSDMKINAEADK
jgi:hypothetical protein